LLIDLRESASRFKEAQKFQDRFRAAWYPEHGFGVPTRVLMARRVDDKREILTLGFVDLPREQLEQGLQQVEANEAIRHDRIAEVIESTVLTGIYEIVDDNDFSTEPQSLRPVGEGLLP
jgi:hypothetical protein